MLSQDCFVFILEERQITVGCTLKKLRNPTPLAHHCRGPQTWRIWILGDFSERGKKLGEFSVNFVQPQGKNCNKRYLDICVRQLLTG